MSVGDLKQVPGFPGYAARADGTIWRTQAWHGMPKSTKLPFELKQTLNEYTGYLQIGMSRDGKRYNSNVHKVICETFHGSRPSPKHQVAHRNGLHVANESENLRWATPMENSADKILHGTDQYGERNPIAVLTERDVLTIRALNAYGFSLYAMAHIMNKTWACVRGVARQGKWPRVQWTPENKAKYGNQEGLACL